MSGLLNMRVECHLLRGNLATDTSRTNVKLDLQTSTIDGAFVASVALSVAAVAAGSHVRADVASILMGDLNGETEKQILNVYNVQLDELHKAPKMADPRFPRADEVTI